MIEDPEVVSADAQAVRDGRLARLELDRTEHHFAGLRQAMLERIAKSSPTESDLRESLYYGVQQLDAVKFALLQAVAAGEAANHAEIVRERFEGRSPH